MIMRHHERHGCTTFGMHLLAADRRGLSAVEITQLPPQAQDLGRQAPRAACEWMQSA
jgi:hypothetical protein